MLVILFEYFFHQPYLPGFYLKTFLLLFVEFLYIIKLCIAKKNFLHVQLVEKISWVHDTVNKWNDYICMNFVVEYILFYFYFRSGM